MPIYHLTAIDIENGFALRADTRPTHLEYLKDLGDDLLMAGPILNNEQKAVGTIAIITAENEIIAKQIFDKDPYAKAGLFASTEIKNINPLFGKWCG
ncbi:YciI family protein [Pseudaquidulcibacter saccharophilus]|uniref:YciI family protein n=1 Tax=Pseudaquidulcibacter saccharophilus TaxID=2831900 RepID=UPI001EFF09D4|nr:YciI family protein [Pseudaquidulcibacter saccharophilus]